MTPIMSSELHGRGIKQPFEAFFLSSSPGKRFAIFYPAQGVHRGTFVYIHPFAEEMNKSRRMAALQARAFSNLGFAVLAIDLYGCGDSEGNLDEATWAIWKQDILYGVEWLSQRKLGPLHIWGLRLGATLGLSIWQSSLDIFESGLLWQPVLKGETFMTQFLRLAIAGDALREAKGGLTTNALRQQISAGNVIEIAGYPLTASLVQELDAQKLENFIIPSKPIYWIDVKSNSSLGIPPATQKIIENWKAEGINVNYQLIEGDAFWATQEIVEVPALIDASCYTYTEFH